MLWFKGLLPLQDQGEFRLETVRKKECHMLILYDVKASDAGQYLCMAVNRCSEISYSFSFSLAPGSTTPLGSRAPQPPRIKSFVQLTSSKALPVRRTRRTLSGGGGGLRPVEVYSVPEDEETQFLCQIEDGCFPEPRVSFYNRMSKHVRNNDYIEIGGI